LEWVANNDIDARVRRIAEEAIISIKQSLQVPKELTEMREEVNRLRSISTDILLRLDRIERELKY
jgi:hypothetical protein